MPATKPPPRRRRKPARKARLHAEPPSGSETDAERDAALASVQVDYVPQPVDLDPLDPQFSEFARVLDRFRIDEGGADEASVDRELREAMQAAAGDAHDAMRISDDDVDMHTEDPAPLSRRQLRKMTQMSVAELKQMVSRPEVVEWFDATAQDPVLLVQLKSYRNTVPVPQHWLKKSRYLSSKRGVEKPPFQLPQFIRDTGIQQMRDAGLQQQAEQKMSSRMRDHMRPRMGRIDIDYQKLHDAFFRYQTRPENMTRFGEMYYEGKEFEARLDRRRPGRISEELRAALNMPPLAPPPWLINMQRFGPPPAYPGLRIPGLNCPIPEGAQWGYHPGGWGSPPVDQNNRPLYGDVFGTSQLAESGQATGEQWAEPVQKELWGELEPEPEMEEEEEEEEEAEEEGEEEEGEEEEEVAQGLATPSGMLSSVPSGLETPEHIELRKQVMDKSSATAGGELYRVLPAKETRTASGLAAARAAYDLSTPAVRKGDVQVSIDPEAAGAGVRGLDRGALHAQYEAQQRARQPQHEDLSEMVAEHAQRQAERQARKRPRTEEARAKKAFKF